MDKLLSLENISFGYGDREILMDISLDISRGDFVLVVGDNGSGKTTFIKGLLGLLEPLKGKINKKDGLVLAYLSQQNDLAQDFPASVFEIVISGRIKHKGSRIRYSFEDRELAEKSLERMGIQDLKNKAFRVLSGGQKQRVLLARALCADGDIIILDEPMAGLDLDSKEVLYKILVDLNINDEKTIIMVSHEENRKFIDKIRLVEIKDFTLRELVSI